MLGVYRRAGLAVGWVWLALVAVAPGWAWAEVRVELSASELTQGRPVQVRIEAAGSTLAVPDLAPLQEDFQIANRNLRQQNSTINGRRSQRITLTLTLIPRRAGALQIPPLKFGGESSRAMPVQVRGGVERSSAEPSQVPARVPAPQADNRDRPWSGQSREAGALSDPYQAQPLAMDGGYSGSQAALADRSAPVAGWSPVAWVAMAVGILVFWLLLRSGGRRLAVAIPEPPPRVTPSAPLPPALLAVREAYRQVDAAAARAALLAWAGQTWPEDTPSNLTRLAGRLQGPAQQAVLQLDQALYSPDPVAWNHLEVWKYLAEV